MNTHKSTTCQRLKKIIARRRDQALHKKLRRFADRNAGQPETSSVVDCALYLCDHIEGVS